jgi:hypothetical protein
MLNPLMLPAYAESLDAPRTPSVTDLTVLLTYSVALVRKRTIPTERLPLVGEVSANSAVV